MNHIFDALIQQLKQKDLYRTFQLKRTSIKNKPSFINLGSNDYLSLTTDEDLLEKWKQSILKYGTGATGSRYITGHSEAHEKIEHLIAQSMKQPKALLFNSGYTANLGVITSFEKAGFTTIILDNNCHASIFDACRQTRLKWKVFQHNDMNHLENCLKRYSEKEKTLIISEGIFSMSGQRAPIKQLSELAINHNSMLYIDEAHSWGICGHKGKGIVNEYLGDLHQPHLLRLITFGKAGGSIGGVVIGANNVIDWITQSSKSLIYTTSLPPAIVELNHHAYLKIMEQKEKRQHLNQLFEYLHKKNITKQKGFSPIIPVQIKTKNRDKLAIQLKKNNIYIPYMRYPTVKSGEEIFRISLTSSIQIKDIELVSKILVPFK